MTEENSPPITGRSESSLDAGHTTFDWSQTEQPSLAVVEAVADATERDPIAVLPLYDSINPDALDTLALVRGFDVTTDIRIEFTHDGVEVTVTGGGTVTVQSKHGE